MRFVDAVDQRLAELCSGSNRRQDRQEVDELLRRLEIPPDLLTNDFLSIAVTAWFKFLNFDGDRSVVHKDRPAQIAVLAVFADLIDADLGGAKEEFQKRNSWFEKSYVELRIRLVARLYKYGRRVWKNYQNKTDATSCYQRALAISDLSESDIDLLSTPQKRIFFGFRGSIRDALGRFIAETDFQYWDQAFQDMKKSYDLGNNNIEAQSFLRGIVAERFIAAEGLELFDETLSLFLNLRQKDDQSIGELIAIAAAAAPRWIAANNTVAFFMAVAGERLTNEALESDTLAKTDTQHIAFLRNQRAFFRALMAQNSPQRSAEEELDWLDNIIVDQRYAHQFGVGGAGLAFSLMVRSDLRFDLEDFEGAGSDLSEATELVAEIENVATRSNLSDRAAASKLRLEFQSHIGRGEIAGAIDALSQVVSLSPASDFHLVFYSATLRRQVEKENFVPSNRQRKQILSYLEHVLTGATGLEGESAFLSLSYAANLCREIDPQVRLPLQTKLYDRSCEVDPKGRIEAIVFAANTSLIAAKNIEASEGGWRSDYLLNATEKYEAAIAMLENAPSNVPEVVIPSIVYSKAGEAYLRHARQTLDEVAAHRRSYELLTKATSLGNDTAENVGLRGDAKYRLGVRTRSVADLLLAADLKQQAKELDGGSRENSSVTSRIFERLFLQRRHIDDLTKAIALALEATLQDPNWAWPLFQLWEMSLKYASQWDQAVSQVKSESWGLASQEHVSAIKRRDSSLLIELAVRVLLSSDEFVRRKLGGRSAVFAVDDPHNLLSSTVVLKPTDKENADREFAAAKFVRERLIESGLTNSFSVVQPLCLVNEAELGDVLALRVANGQTLARKAILLERQGRFNSPELIGGVARFLAEFHRPGLDWKNLYDLTGLEAFLFRISKKAGRELVRAAVASCVHEPLPAVLKKDAHAENWIIDSSGKITMIDLEAVSRQPVFADLSQLFDDYPAFPNSPKGWREREQVATNYLLSLDSNILQCIELRPMLELMAIWRIVMMRQVLFGKAKGAGSESSLKSIKMRERHLNSTLQYLRENSSTRSIQDLAHAVS